MVIIMWNIITSFSILTAMAAVAAACDLPADWHGSWIGRAYRGNIVTDFTRNEVSRRGRCVKKDDRDRYLFRQTKYNEEGVLQTCYTCMVITVRHANVLQFREGSYCSSTHTRGDPMTTVCSQRNVGPQSPLHTIVKVDASPIACPEIFQRHTQFTYSGVNGYCQDESAKTSRVYQCASDRDVRINFASCRNPDYAARDYKLTCLASWNDGGNWLFAKYGGDNFSCLYMDPTTNQVSLSVTGDCTGLSLLSSTPILLNWIQDAIVPEVTATCTFPTWFKNSGWDDLQSQYLYRFDPTTRQLVVEDRVNNVASQRHTCHQKDRRNQYITQVINDCDHGYQCVILRKKSNTIAEITIGKITANANEACSWTNLHTSGAETKILRDNRAQLVHCPFQGIYSLPESSRSCTPTLEAACSSNHAITINRCNNNKRELLCSASWNEGSVKKLVLTDRLSQQANCYKYTDDGKVSQLQIDEQCNRRAPIQSGMEIFATPFQLNITRHCGDASKTANIKDNYISGETASSNLPLHSASNIQKLTSGTLILAVLTFTF